MPGVRERGPQAGIKYVGAVDPAGGGPDSYTLAIAHRVGDIMVLDAIRERKGSPEAATQEYAALLKSYGIGTVTGDNYAGTWPKEAFARYGITYIKEDRPRTAIYLAVLPLINSQRVELLDGQPRMLVQFLNLVRTAGPSGRDVINHPERGGYHDDLSVAASLALMLASVAAQPMRFAPPPAGISRSEIYRQAEQDIFANNGVGLPYDSGDCSCPPGGWPAGEALQQSLDKFLSQYGELSSDFHELDKLGYGPTTWALVKINMQKAVATALQFTDLRQEFLAPHERRTFGAVIAAWASNVRARAERRLARGNEDNAASEATMTAINFTKATTGDIPTMIFFAKKLLDGEPTAFAKHDFIDAIQVRADAIYPDRLSPQSRFTKAILEDEVAKTLYRACKAAPGTEVRAPVEKTDDGPVHIGPAHAKMHSLAIDRQRERPIGYAAAYSEVYNHGTNAALRRKVQAEHLEHQLSMMAGSGGVSGSLSITEAQNLEPTRSFSTAGQYSRDIAAKPAVKSATAEAELERLARKYHAEHADKSYEQSFYKILTAPEHRALARRAQDERIAALGCRCAV
jgi:hypothetical protein